MSRLHLLIAGFFSMSLAFAATGDTRPVRAESVRIGSTTVVQVEAGGRFFEAHRTDSAVTALDAGGDAEGTALFATWDEAGRRWSAYSRDGGASWAPARPLNQTLLLRDGAAGPEDALPAPIGGLALPSDGSIHIVQFRTVSLPEWRASLVDLESSSVPEDLPIKGRAASLVAAGQLSFFMELADSQSGEVLARAGDKEKAPAPIAGSATGPDWARTEEAADRWAQMFRDFLDENLGK